jgi:hypothetical protein
MNKINIGAIVLAISLACSGNAMAQNMSKSEYKAAHKHIVAEYTSDKAHCGSLAGNARDICIAEAKGKEKVAKAELEARYKPSKKTRYDVRVAKAEADYAVAREKCDDKAGNAKDVCVKEAKAALVRGKSDARAQLKTSEANATANEESAEARMKAKETGSEARHDAAAEKRDADYAVAQEKCNAMAGDAKDRCMNEAKMHYGK